jgi:hypothetical protein
MATIHDILQEQKILAIRLTKLTKMVNLLLKEDLLKHEHTIDYYINQLEDARYDAELLNKKVDAIVKQATKNKKLEDY